ncbi:MAG: hypothetical protein ACFFAN_20345 [Promethearchaeota archaeon]
MYTNHNWNVFTTICVISLYDGLRCHHRKCVSLSLLVPILSLVILPAGLKKGVEVMRWRWRNK